MCERKAYVLLRGNIVKNVLAVIYSLLCVPEEDPDENDTVHKSAAQLLDRVCLTVAPEHTFEPSILAAAGALPCLLVAMRLRSGFDSLCILVPSHAGFFSRLNRAMSPFLSPPSELVNSNNWAERKAGYTIVAMLAEGCQEMMRENLLQLLDMVEAGLNDSNKVRARTCVCGRVWACVGVCGCSGDGVRVAGVWACVDMRGRAWAGVWACVGAVAMASWDTGFLLSPVAVIG